MNLAKNTPPAPHAQIALKRLRQLCGGGAPLFMLVHHAAAALGQARAHSVSRKVKPDLRTVVAAVLNAPTFNDIGPLAEHEYDEKIGPTSLAKRRNQQAGHLAAFLTRTAEDHGLPIPQDLAAHSVEVINEWQPTAREPEIKVHLANKMQENARQHFAVAQLRMEIAFRSDLDPLPEDIDEACAILRVLDPTRLLPREERFRRLMMENMGLVAVRMANSGEEAKRTYALQMFEALYKQGAGHAGVHVARMRFDGWGTEKKGRDIGKANSDIDKVFADFTQGNRGLFQTRSGLKEMLTLRIRIKHELIINGKDDPQVVFKRTKELIGTLLECLRYEFEDYGVELAMLLAPNNTVPNELRKIIDAHDELKAYCLRMHEDICAQARANGIEMPESPSPTHV